VEMRTGVRAQPLVIRDDSVRQVRAGDLVFACDAVVSTVALPALGRLVPERSDPYFARVREVDYIGVVCNRPVVVMEFPPNAAATCTPSRETLPCLACPPSLAAMS
jgi:hypothetical protein